MDTHRNYSIDSLRTIATLLVICIHVYAPFFKEFSSNNLGVDFWIANGIDSFSRFSVPVFVMISGYFLIGRNEPLQLFFNNRAKKIIVPIIFWTLFYSFYTHLGSIVKFGTIDFSAVAIAIVEGKPYYHLWYVYMLLGLYASVPFLNLMIKTVSIDRTKQIIVFLFIIGLINTTYEFLFEINSFFVLWFINYLGYFLLGYYVKKSVSSISNSKLIFIFLMASMLIVFLTYLTFQVWGSLYFYLYLSPFVILASIAVFKLFTQIEIKKNWLSNLSEHSFGVYLIHAFILHVLLTFGKKYNPHFFEPKFGLLVVLLVFCLSVMCVKVIHQIPYLKKIV